MTRAQAGDVAAYKQLLEDVTPYLRALTRRRLPAQSDVEDVVQNILLTVHSIRATYDPALPFGPWLKAIAMHRIIDRLRYQYRHHACEREILDGIDTQMHHRVVHRGDLARQVVVGRVHHLEDLHRDHRVLVDHLHQILGRAVDVAGELQDALHALREGRHAVHRGAKFLREFGGHS